MTISQKMTPEDTAAGQLSCPHCKTALPPQAAFCGSCGERLPKQKQAVLPEEQDIQTRYRIKTLVRRYPHTNLYFALDHSQTQNSGSARMVAVRDIDVAGLEKEVRTQAMLLAQQEYDCLRRWNLPYTLACIDLRVFQGHIFLISSLPNATNSSGQQRLYTLQDFLQSGLGLPREARTLEWVGNLGQAVERLHRHRIVLGDLDPYTVVLDKNSAQAEPRLMPFWLWPELRELLPQPWPAPSPQVSYFKAPEALAGKASTRSDIYSLGALLYLLLTGTPPDESTLRHRRRLRTPREVNSRISQYVDDCVMRALAVEPEGRYPNVGAFLTALEDARANQPPRKAFPPPVHMPEIPLSDVETVRIVPLSQKDVQRWRAAGEERAGQKEQASARASQSLPARRALPPASTLSSPVEAETPATPGTLPTTPLPERVDQKPTLPLTAAQRNPITPPPLPDEPRPSWPRRITHILPASKAEEVPAKKERSRRKKSTPKALPVPASMPSEGELSLLKQIQRLLLGQQQRAIAAAAIIETPMRVRPDQPYNLRLHIMGRDEPAPPSEGVAPAGLSALVHGEIALVEVRSVLQQGYTYILQQASVTIPAAGYAAEVTIPMQQQTITPTGRRDRLHIFFLDEQRNPLYEKPFVVEVFVSPLVQFGREGHQVLTIPL
jgi:serine/threonine protein kinase